MDESIDTAQLAIFIRGVDSKFSITEELLSLFPMTGTTKGSDILEAVKSTLIRFNINLRKLSGDGAPDQQW